MIPRPPAPTHPAACRRILLMGFMGAGKSTLGRLLAERLGWAFLDLDTHLETRTSSTIPALFAEHGEAHFRRLESSALASALGLSRTVLALGGGVPEVLTNRLLIEQTPATFTIFLEAPFAILAERCRNDALNPAAILRPIFADPFAAQARFEARLPFYRRLANLTLDTCTLSPEAAADHLAGQLTAQLL